MYKIFFLLCFTLISTLAFGQSFKEFSQDREAYAADLQTFFKDIEPRDKDAREAHEALLLSFNQVWSSGGLSDPEAAEIYKISNNFLKKRMTAYEGWADFLGIIIHMETNQDEAHLLPWLQDMEQLSRSEPARASQDYLHTTYLTFVENVLYDDGRIKWKVPAGEYEYSFEGQPMFTFKSADVWGYFKDDSTMIEGTAGVFYPREYLFKGNGGVTYFIRAGLSQDSANVELADYAINVRKTDFEADSVKLSTLFFLKEPTLGHFQEKLTSQGGRDATFPRFTSYRENIEIKDLVPGADFIGGFTMIGSKFYGGGSEKSKATFRFSYDGKEVFTARAERFRLRFDKIESNDVALSLKMEDDSLYHPKVTLRYLPELKRLNIIRENEGLGQTPFSDTYHDMDMVFERISWKTDEPQMEIGNITVGSESPVLFESKEYYRGNRFAALSGLDTQNPLYRLQNMARTYGTDTIALSDVARFLRMDLQNAHIYMMRMYIMGFVEYNMETRTTVINPKVDAYIANFEKKRDFDVIRFVSNSAEGSNARLSLLNYDMEIEGVEAIALSDSQKVGLFPKNGQIIVHKDLNFDFDGRITAGRFTYWGELFKFNYDQFRINMDNIDSMRFKVESFETNALGQRSLVNVKTVLQGLTGELLIDDPKNKSGKEVFTQYPIFKCTRNSYIYYDKKSIFGGVYDKSEFFVELEPFEIDSLDNISTEGINFAGTFTSAGIFPELQQEIKVQPDYSLGFTTETPPSGLSAYGGKGTFTSELSLSNLGLRGDGRIDYLNSYALSDEFFFFPDSTNGLANEYEIKAQTAAVENPHVVGKSVKLHWEPKNDVLYTTSTRESPFDMYDAIGMRGTGTLAHSPSSLRGKGLLEFLNAETRSEDYLFKNRRFSSEKLAFQVRANPEAEWGFGMDNAKGEVNFDKQLGDFYLNDPANYFSFPANKYICYMDYARWSIPEKAISVKKTGSQASSTMVSVHPQQDSLRFEAGRTKFYLENSLLESFAVPNIDVADASIFPDTGYVAIEENARMRTLNNAAITASRQNKYHDFYGGVLNIQSRNSYTGTADYEYMDKDGTPWPIRFENIRVEDTSLTTVGSASIKQEDAFYMSPYFAYYGQVKLIASRKALDFRGHTHIESSCPSVSTDWFAFSSIVDPAHIIIDLPEIDPNDKTKTLANGIYLAADTIGGYAAFLSKDVSPADKQMFFANGKLYYDESIGSYVITTAERLADPEGKGNYLAFNNTKCTMHGEGEMSLGDEKSQLQINSWGAIDYNLNNDVMTMDMALGFNFFFSDDVLKEMAKEINKKTLLEGTDMSRPAFENALNQELSVKDRKEFREDVSQFGAPEEIPDELQNTILLTDVKIKWTPEAISFLSEGMIGVGSLGKYIVNKKMKGYLEIQRRRRGDEVYLYLEPDRSTYFYVEYKRNQLSLFTGEDPIMNIIKELDLDKRRQEVKGLPPFTYTVGTKGRMNRFLQRFEKFE